MEDTTIQGLEVRRVPIDSLHLDPANARTHGELNLNAIKSSLERFGQVEPLVIHKGTGRVIGGNGRVVAMQALGWTECDVVELDLSDIDATALGIALNRTAELAEWDSPVLGKLLQQLKVDDALEGVGFDDAEIDALIAELENSLEATDLDDPGPGEMPEDPVTRAGDLWVLGMHRLLCGDATQKRDVERLMSGDLADLIWTDPPYGVSYVGKTADALTIENDQLDDVALERLLTAALGHACDACRPGAVWYVAAPAGPNFLPFAKCLTELGVWRQTLVWLKDVFVLGRSDFHYRHEALFYGWKPGAAHREPPDRCGDTIWEVDRPRVSADHPTCKPTDLVRRAIETSSGKNDIVLDPFVGSGTTLVAAEATGRRCRALEVDPCYCDVAVRRWQEASGGEAVLDASGKTFTTVAGERGQR